MGIVVWVLYILYIFLFLFLTKPTLHYTFFKIIFYLFASFTRKKKKRLFKL